MARVRVTKLRKYQAESRLELWCENKIDNIIGMASRVESGIEFQATVYFSLIYFSPNYAKGKTKRSSIRMYGNDTAIAVSSTMNRKLLYKMFMSAITINGWQFVEVR